MRRGLGLIRLEALTPDSIERQRLVRDEELAQAILEALRELRAATEGRGAGALPDRPLTRVEAAAYLNVRPATLYDWARENRVAYSRLGDGPRAAMRFLRADLDDFLRANRIPVVA